MAATKYTYSISGDFPNQQVNSALLERQVNDSAIVTALNYIGTFGNVCDIWFADALSGGDETILDGLVAAHQGVASTAHQIRRKSGAPSSTSGAWTTKHDFTTPPLAAGWWEVDVSYELKLDTQGGQDGSKARVNLYKNATPEQSPMGLGVVGRDTFDTRYHAISVQLEEGDTLRAHCEFRLEGDTNTAYIRKYRVRFTPVESGDES